MINDAQGRGGRLEAGRGEAMVEAKTGPGGETAATDSKSIRTSRYTQNTHRRKARPAHSGEKTEERDVTEYCEC